MNGLITIAIAIGIVIISSTIAGAGLGRMRSGRRTPKPVGDIATDVGTDVGALTKVPYSELYPILDTDYSNQLAPVMYWNTPGQPVDTGNPYWTVLLPTVNGHTALVNDMPLFEWLPILQQFNYKQYQSGSQFEPEYYTGVDTTDEGILALERRNGDLVGVSGTVVLNGPLQDEAHPLTNQDQPNKDQPNKDPRVSGGDVPLTHPFGNDVEFCIVPDSPYLPLLGVTNWDLHPMGFRINEEYQNAINKALNRPPYGTMQNPGIGLSNASVAAVLGVETDEANMPHDYRPLDGDRTVVFGRWIVDAGHDDFHTEIHPPLLVVNARSRSNGEVTHSPLIGRAFLVSQLFNNDAGQRITGIHGALLSQLAPQITNFVESIQTPDIQQLDLRPEIFAGILTRDNAPFIVDGEPPIAMTYRLRPPSPRKNAGDELVISYNFTTRTGVSVRLFDTTDDGVQVVIRINNFYSPPVGAQPLQPGTRKDEQYSSYDVSQVPTREKVLYVRDLSVLSNPPLPSTATSQDVWNALGERHGLSPELLNVLEALYLPYTVTNETLENRNVRNEYGYPVAIYDNPELSGALVSKAQDIAANHGDDVARFFWDIIERGARFFDVDRANWPQAAQNLQFAVANEQVKGGLPILDPDLGIDAYEPIDVEINDQQAFPIYGYVDVRWRRAVPKPPYEVMGSSDITESTGVPFSPPLPPPNTGHNPVAPPNSVDQGL